MAHLDIGVCGWWRPSVLYQVKQREIRKFIVVFALALLRLPTAALHAAVAENTRPARQGTQSPHLV